MGASALVGAFIAVPPQHAIPGQVSVAAQHLMVLHESLVLPTTNLDLSVSAELLAEVDLSAAAEALVAGLASLDGLIGPPVAALLDGMADVAIDVAAFADVGVTALAAAVEWFAQLEAVLADAVVGGGVDSPVAVLAALLNQVAVGVDTGLLVWAEAVNLGADVVGGIALLPASLGVALNAEITAAVLAGIEALVPIIGPLPAGLVTAVTTLSGVLDAAITLPGQAIAWKAELDAVLADLVATGGVALTNNLTGGLMGAVGAEPVGLPDVGEAEVNASLDAVVDHVTVGLVDVFVGDPPPEVTPEPDIPSQNLEVTNTRAAEGLPKPGLTLDAVQIGAEIVPRTTQQATRLAESLATDAGQQEEPEAGKSVPKASVPRPDRGPAAKEDGGAKSIDP